MHGLILDSRSSGPQLLTSSRSAEAGERESWLQELLFTHPTLVPLDRIDPAAGAFIPVCRELPLPGAGGSVFLDIFGVTPAGRPVLIECKLWRNPEARRKVVGQILEYAGLLQRWSYGDLVTQVARRLGDSGDNPLFGVVRRHCPEADEARFVETVSTCLATGDFDLVIAGDGIRTDLQAIAAFIRNRTIARLALVEYQVWTDAAAEEEERATVESVVNPTVAAARSANRGFWDSFIAQARFSHPDQPPPRHGGNNWVRLDMPAPARMTAYRSDGVVGVFVTLTGDGARDVYERLSAEQAVIEAEIEQNLVVKSDSSKPDTFTIAVTHPFDTRNAGTEDAQRRWLLDTADRFVTAFRLRLGHGGAPGLG